jgi:hypothetical protein
MRNTCTTSCRWRTRASILYRDFLPASVRCDSRIFARVRCYTIPDPIQYSLMLRFCA